MAQLYIIKMIYKCFIVHCYSGWKKSCTTLDGWNPINNGTNPPFSTGAIFRNHPQYFDGLPSYLMVFQLFPLATSIFFGGYYSHVGMGQN